MYFSHHTTGRASSTSFDNVKRDGDYFPKIRERVELCSVECFVSGFTHDNPRGAVKGRGDFKHIAGEARDLVFREEDNLKAIRYEAVFE
jgi:hypothetical protein